ncbi:Aste57867_8402 [Aphanomyces stellatus]|uniref:Aste57867_8402 protein n=1 Tax=Aphanomyces stellatus TaxID=120398 RepID=A0A485KK60_9STRA|nr:hypothetical protein As57867_008370 [Aphanomyces stellatus]VFT85288.1 Aste57867_8402 [Aphanomyces stellatus]
MELIEELFASMHNELDKLNIPFLDTLEEQTGVDKVVLVFLAALLLWMLFIGGVGSSFVCTTVGFAYPGYASFRVLQKPAIIRAGEVRLWLMFWITFACFKFVEVFADKAFSVVPNYNTFKLCAILALFLPSTRRATSFYTKVLVPALKPNESDVDKLVRETQFELDGMFAKVYNTDLFQGALNMFKPKKD